MRLIQGLARAVDQIRELTSPAHTVLYTKRTPWPFPPAMPPLFFWASNGSGIHKKKKKKKLMGASRTAQRRRGKKPCSGEGKRERRKSAATIFVQLPSIKAARG